MTRIGLDTRARPTAAAEDIALTPPPPPSDHTPPSMTRALRLVSAPASSAAALTPPRTVKAGSCGIVRSALNPLCQSLRDLSDRSFDAAAALARNENLAAFKWNGARYMVKADSRSSALTPEQQLAKNGITDAQYNSAYVPGLSERFFERLTPVFYNHISAALNAYANHDDGARNLLLKGTWPVDDHGHSPWTSISPNARLDAWAVYLGLPQTHDTFRVAPYTPAGEAPGAAEHLSFSDTAMHEALLRYAVTKLPAEVDDHTSYHWWSPERRNAQMTATDDSFSDFNGNKVLGHFLLERRHDERGHYVAYTYTWKLRPLEGLPLLVGPLLAHAHVPTPEASEVAGVGHPFAIYGRVYYDPATGKRLDPQP